MRFAPLFSIVSLGLSLLSACGSDPIAPIEGAMNLSFSTNADQCTQEPHLITLGTVSANNATGVQEGKGANIKCVVRPIDGGHFAVSLNINKADSHDFLQVNIRDMDPAASIDHPSIGSLSLASDKTLSSYNTPPNNGSGTGGCQFYFESPQEKISAGNFWASFDCPKLVQTGSTCSLRTSYVSVQNCDTEE